MVLAAGGGRRMRPLTLLRAKPALPVLNRPLIQWTLERLVAAGVRDVLINLHHRPASVVRAVGNGSGFGLRVTYSRERTLLGTGGGPRAVRRFFGDEPCLILNGDMVFDLDLTALIARHHASGASATLALLPNPDPRRYGPIVTGPGGWVQSVPGSPRRLSGRVSLFAGIHVLDPSLLDRLPAGPSDSVRDLYAPFVAEGGRVLGVRLRGAWYDLSSPALYLASHRALLTRAPGGRRALIAPDVRVHEAARVSTSVVGPGTVIEEGASVTGSVLWDGVRVGRGARVRDCILASRVRVGVGERVERRVIVRRRDRQHSVSVK